MAREQRFKRQQHRSLIVNDYDFIHSSEPGTVPEKWAQRQFFIGLLPAAPSQGHNQPDSQFAGFRIIDRFQLPAKRIQHAPNIK
jgi:hypothetical protein